MALKNFTGKFKEPFYEKNIRLIHGDYDNIENNTNFEYQDANTITSTLIGRLDYYISFKLEIANSTKEINQNKIFCKRFLHPIGFAFFCFDKGLNIFST